MSRIVTRFAVSALLACLAQLVLSQSALATVQITGFTPQADPVGTVVTISGNGFTTADNVLFGGVASDSIVYQIAQGKILARVPPGAVTGRIRVVGSPTSDYDVTSTNFTLTPKLGTLSATSGVVGNVITLSGSNFASPPSANSVTFNGTPAMVGPSSTTSLLYITVPPNATTGPLVVTVAGVAATATSTFTINCPSGYSVTTLAGLAATAGSADGTGSAARFSTPQSVAVDASGNVYVADFANDTIRKITQAGVVTTYAGAAGVRGSTDGAASAARFQLPGGVVLDSAGNLYVADTGNNTIRKISTSGTVSTLAGVAGSPGSLDGTGTTARFYNPNGITIDAAGNLYTVDTANDTVRKITPAGVVTTIAGSPGLAGSADGTGSAARFSSPYGIAIDSAGNLYVADTGNSTMRKITPAGVVTTIAGAAGITGTTDGAGTTARFRLPYSVVADSLNNLYVTDTYNQTIRLISPSGVVSTIAGAAGTASTVDGIGGAAQFNYPDGIAVDSSGNLYVAEWHGNTVRKMVAVSNCPAPTCTSMGPKNVTIANSASTARFYAYGVQNATAVYFPTWWVDGGNQNDIQWLGGTSDGGGQWHVDVPLSQYDTGNPRYGNFATHVYLVNPNYQSGAYQWCDGTGWVRQAPPPPDAPTAISVPASTASGIFNVSWTAATTGTAATTFTLQQATSLSGPWTALSSTIPVGTTSYSVTVNTSGTYYFQVAACNAAGCSTFNQSSGVVATLSVPSCTSIGFAANPVPYGTNTQRVYAYGVQNATIVYYPTWWIPGGQADIQWPMGINQGAGTWYVDIDLTKFDPGTPRYGAFETDVYMGNSSYHNGALVGCGGGSWTRTAPPAPAAPTSVSATGSTSNVLVSWVPNTSAGPIDLFQLKRATSAGGPWTNVNLNITPGTTTSYTDSSLPAGTYYYEVAACNSSGCSTFTVSGAATVIAAVVSDTPSITAPPGRDSTSDGVGATLAQFRVDEGGNATYSIPIQVPPGTAGVTPKLALTYNSRLPAGVMGAGWTVDGASQISRCRQARENGDFMSGSTPVDGNPAPVNFTSTDRFCLDGVRLLLLSGSYGANGSTYSPETDPTTRVTATVTNANAGPVTFAVQRKDGTSSTYGATTSSPNAGPTATLNGQSVNVAWSLARVQDSVGNYMDYLYNNKPASGTYGFAAGAIESTLASVNYTGHLSPASATYASVAFTYSTLPVTAVRLGYQSGIAFVQSQQLQSVTVTDSTQSPSTLRYYQLSYQTSSSGSNVQELSQVQECRDSSMGVCYPATTFNWSAANYALASEGTQNGPNFTYLVGYKIADVDGDGRPDFVFAVDGDSHCSGVSAIYVGFMDRSGSNQLTLNLGSQTPTCSTIDLNGNDQAWYLVDYDGDGMSDLMIGGASSSTWSVYQSQGRPSSGKVFTTDLLSTLTTPIKAPNCYTDFSGATVCNPAAGILADLNGDGLPDFIYPNPDPFASPTLLARVMVRNASGAFQFSDPYTVTLSDYFDDACGGADMCNLGLFSNNDGLHRSAIATDFNGDGRADLTFSVTGVTLPAGTQVSGTKPAHTPLQYAPIGSSDSGSVVPGSGSSPAAVGTTTRNTYWYQFNAQTIDPVAKSVTMNLYWHAQAKTSSFPSATLPAAANKFFVVDLNGDGLADILYQDPNNAQTFAVMLNTGSTYQAPITVSGILTNSSDGSPTIQLADINGDGRPDLLYPSAATGTAAYSYVTLFPDASASGGWSFSSAQTAPAGLQANAGWIALLADFDGDGAADFLRINRASTSNVYTARAASGSRYNARDVIAGFTNGLGAKTTVVYQPLTNHGVYQWGVNASPGGPRSHALTSVWGYGSPVFDVLAPMYVVSQASSSAPTSGAPSATSTVYYRYQGAVMQSGGRGFLGFWAIWTFDNNDTAIESNQYMATLNGYGQQFPFIGFPEATYKMAFSGSLTRGNATLDACANNGPEANSSCFAPGVPNSATTDPTQWPDIKSNGVLISASETLPYCNGSGCTAAPTSLTNLCTGVSTSMSRPSAIGQITDGIFTPQSTPGPIFSYALDSTDQQFDLGNPAGFGGSAPTAKVESTFCYDTSLPSHGNLVNSSVLTKDSADSIVAQKLTANAYGAEDMTHWFLGRLTTSQVTFKRPNQSNVVRTSDFSYDINTGLLISERVQKNGTADQDLRTLYVLDSYGNRTAAYQCSNDLTDAQCKSTSGFIEQQSGTQVHRYAKTTYDSRGRYSSSSAMPFSGASGGLNEQTAMSVGMRDEFGNPTQQHSINDAVGYMLNGISTTQFSVFGALGRPYFTGDDTGKASTTTYRTCGSGATCGDTMFKFRSQTNTVGAPTSWTYFDVLGRPVMKVAENFNIENNTTGQLYSATCGYYDAHNRPVYQSEPFFLNVAKAADNTPNLSATASPCSGAVAATSSSYDVLGRAVRITNPDGGVINKSYLGLTSFTSSPRNSGWQWEETKNALGETIETRDPDDPSDPYDNLIVSTYYDAAGNVLQIQRNAGGGVITTSANYDVLGRKVNQTDPDAGYASFTYNAAGDVLTQTDAKGQKTTSSYDAMGRRWQRAVTNAADGNNFTDTWTFDTAAHGFGQLATEARPAFGNQQPFSRNYVYDAYGRLYQRTTNIYVTSSYTESTAYDGYGRLKAQQDVTGYALNPHYTPHGFVDYQNESRTGTRTYQMLSANERGQVVSDQRGGIAALASVHSYNAKTGRLYQLCSGNGASLASGNCAGGNLQNLAYNFDVAGNLSARSHLVNGQTLVEFFKYDALNRLTDAGVPTQSTALTQNPVFTDALKITYDKLGNICTKATTQGTQTSTQTYSYAGLAGCANHGSSGSPHAVTAISGPSSLSYAYDTDGNQTTTTGGSGRVLTYDALNQMTKASNNTDSAQFQYGDTGERFQRVDKNGTRTTYIGNVEIVVTGASTEYRRYLAGTAIDYVRPGGSNETRYLFADHLGSADVIAKSDGTLLENTSFDAHGSRRDASAWSGSGTALASTTHGFTGHEQLDTLGLIHMNGRVYDPQLGRMLQADPLTGPGPQGLNRYSYVANNPLTLTDPSGYSWWSWIRTIAAIAITVWTGGLALAATSFLEGVAIAAAGGFAAGVIQTGTLQGGLIGAFSAAVFFGIGHYFQAAEWAHEEGTIGATNLNSIGYGAKILAHGVAGGVMQSLEGGKFGAGFLSAGVAEAASPAVDGLDPSHPVGQFVSAQRVAAAALVGGTTSVIAGGKFGNGAITAAFSRAFNEEAEAKRRLPSFDKLKENYPRNDDGSIAHPSADPYPNQCAIRLGADLIASGEDLSTYTDPKTSEGYPRGSQSLMDWMTRTYGAPVDTTYDYFYQYVYPSQQGIFVEFSWSAASNRWDTFHIDIFYQGHSGSGFFGGQPPLPTAKVDYWVIK